MTPDELKARCAAFLIASPMNIAISEEPECLAALESLCREMVAEGLERAAVQAETRQGMILAPGYHIEFESGFRCANYDLQYWCRREAQRAKENHDTKEAGQI